MGPTLMLCDMD